MNPPAKRSGAREGEPTGGSADRGGGTGWSPHEFRQTTTETVETSSVEETQALAERLAATLAAGDVVYLEGELAAGKTHFVKGLAVGLGIDPDTVRSPTFTFVDFHAAAAPPGRGIALIHADLYRVGGPADLVELGLDEMPGPGAILALEWPERLTRRAARAMTVRITDLGGSRRRIEIER